MTRFVVARLYRAWSTILHVATRSKPGKWFVVARLYHAWFTILNGATSAIKSRDYETGPILKRTFHCAINKSFLSRIYMISKKN
jgi:hypothetical protein